MYCFWYMFLHIYIKILCLMLLYQNCVCKHYIITVQYFMVQCEIILVSWWISAKYYMYMTHKLIVNLVAYRNVSSYSSSLCIIYFRSLSCIKGQWLFVEPGLFSVCQKQNYVFLHEVHSLTFHCMMFCVDSFTVFFIM